MTIKILSDGPTSSPLRAAGGFIIAADTLNVLTVLRSHKVDDGRCWCGVGGKIDGDETPEEAARREIFEEIGYGGPLKLLPALIYESDTLQFYNYVGVVPKQFIATLNWESDGYAWTRLSDIPTPFHFGLDALLNDKRSASLVAKVLRALEQRLATQADG